MATLVRLKADIKNPTESALPHGAFSRFCRTYVRDRGVESQEGYRVLEKYTVTIRNGASSSSYKTYRVIAASRKLRSKKNMRRCSSSYAIVPSKKATPPHVAKVQLAYITVLRGTGFHRRVRNFSTSVLCVV